MPARNTHHHWNVTKDRRRPFPENLLGADTALIYCPRLDQPECINLCNCSRCSHFYFRERLLVCFDESLPTNT